MKIAVAMDSFKGSLTSLEAGIAVRDGILSAVKGAQVSVFPLADGGEGTAKAIISQGAKLCTVKASDPLGNTIECQYAVLQDGTAVLDMSAAAGITLIPAEKRSPLNTTTYGVGEMIRSAVLSGCRDFIIGLGGSATNDCGIGMLQALGFDILDEHSNPVPFGAAGVKAAAVISTHRALPQLKDCSFTAACDVTNPLYGEHGCSKVFALQKGANTQMAEDMDRWIASFSELCKGKFPHADECFPGAGAAGGLGFALKTFLGAQLKSGAQIVLEQNGFEEAAKAADIVVTGEGRFDSQTAMGKAPLCAARTAKSFGKPVIVFCGSACANGADIPHIDACFPILQEPCSLEEAMLPERAKSNLRACSKQVFSLINRLSKQ